MEQQDDRTKRLKREWWENNQDKAIEYTRKWNRNNAQFRRDSTRRYKKENREKTRAQSKIAYRTRKNMIPNASDLSCFVCGGQACLYHHVDYDKPLEVIPVCKPCHQKWHNSMDQSGSTYVPKDNG